MPITIAVLRASGLTAEQIVRVLEREEAERIARRREQNRINKQNQRSRQQFRDDRDDIADTPPPPCPPSPHPSPLNPPLPQKNAASRGFRLPSDWKPAQIDFDFARAQGLLPSEINREAEAFRDFWTAKPGKDGLKLDWSATWRNRIRNYLLRRPNGPSVPPDTAWKLQKAMADTLARRNGSG